MTAVRIPSRPGTKKTSAPNRKLLAVLGVVMALALAFKVAPGLLGGGAGVTVPRPVATFRLHAPVSTATAKGAASGPVVRTRRDPFGAPPGYATPGH
jgi:hypothetical protein